MGHFYDVIEGKGKDRREAFWDAWGLFTIENGTRCSLRSDWQAEQDEPPWHWQDKSDLEPYGDGKPCCYAEFVEALPPLKWVTTTVEDRGMPYGSLRGEPPRLGKVSVQVQQPDPDAPKDQWLQRWRFRVHYHA